jgi:hypothetical protein
MQGGDEMPLEPKQRLCCRCRITYNSRACCRKSSSKKFRVAWFAPFDKESAMALLQDSCKVHGGSDESNAADPNPLRSSGKRLTDTGLKAMQVFRI